jgi:uncharacterized membrane protein
MEHADHQSHHKASYEKPCLADKLTNFMGSWKFIIIQSIVIFFWIVFNAYGLLSWDIYPFIFLNLALSFQAAFTAPIIMMSQNKDIANDRKKSELDYKVNVKAEKKVEEIIAKLDLMQAQLDKLSKK